ncbi:MAG TPA: hypothetical protein EYN96_06600 [Candidatus Hydrogenedentes bacterium]|nr:hypothetical protein [Candidatus Hydrogenedentota bacterium]
MNLSSTSKSKTLKQFPLPTSAFSFAIAILVVVRMFLALNPTPLFPLIRSLGENYAQLLEINHTRILSNLSKGDSIHPRLILMGSSRLLRLPAGNLVQALKLRNSEIRVYATPSSTYFSLNRLVKRYPDIILDCEAVIIEILPSQMNLRFGGSEATEIFMQQATFEEKRRLTRRSDRFLAYADTLFPFYSMRYSPQEWYMGITLDYETILDYNADLAKSTTKKLLATLTKRSEERQVRLALLSEYPPVYHLDVQRQALFSLFDSFPETTSIILVRPPYRDDTDKLLRENPSASTSMRAFRKFIDSINRKNVEVIWIEKASDIGMTNEDYTVDGAHFSDSGLNKLSTLFTKILNERNLLDRH